MKENKAYGWIQLHNGQQFDFDNPSLNGITLRTIGHSLANQCRFNGHTKRFYSVAEHSVVGTRAIRTAVAADRTLWLYEGALARAFLLHDAAEAIICDLPRPLRKMPLCAGVNSVIKQVERLIRNRWSGWHDHPLILQTDLRMLATEKEQLLHPAPRDWGPMLEPLSNTRLECWDPVRAEELFVNECALLDLDLD